jgi:hypothetical protein
MNQELSRSPYCISSSLFTRGLSSAQSVPDLNPSNCHLSHKKNLNSDASDELGIGLSTQAASTSFEASSSLETLLMIFSPSQLGAQLLNQVHSVTGLPWWASIPLATLTIRTALLPLSVKAKASSANLILINQALTKARKIRDKIQSSNFPGGIAMDVTSAASGVDKAVKGIGMWSLTRGTYLHFRAQHSVPSFSWYILNALTQVRLALSNSSQHEEQPLKRRESQNAYFFIKPSSLLFSIS